MTNPASYLAVAYMVGPIYNRRRRGFRYPGEIVVAADLANKSTEAEMNEQTLGLGPETQFP